MKVCYFGTYRANYVRNVVMIERLKRAGVEVLECHETLWHGIDDRVNIASGGWKNPGFWKRLIVTYWNLIIRYIRIDNHEVLIVGYPGQLDVLFARVLSWFRRKPLVWDICTSSYLVAVERGLDNKSKISIQLLRILEYFACRLPDLLLHITDEYVKWYMELFKVPEDKFKIVSIGADDRIFYPRPKELRQDNKFIVLYFGTYIPNHRSETIIEAANILKENPDILFLFIGTGPDEAKCKELATRYSLVNTTFIGWMNENELTQQIANADVVLGVFGETPQSLITIHNKVFIGMAMKKTIITAESPAIKREMQHGVHLFLCNRKDPQSLANAIITLQKDHSLSEKLACQGFKLYQQKYTLDKLGKTYFHHLSELLEQTR
jgi:glycosyltransferase involved in cell wall biosynthesis